MLKLCTPGVTHFRHTDRDRRRLNLGHLNPKPRLKLSCDAIFDSVFSVTLFHRHLQMRRARLNRKCRVSRVSLSWHTQVAIQPWKQSVCTIILIDSKTTQGTTCTVFVHLFHRSDDLQQKYSKIILQTTEFLKMNKGLLVPAVRFFANKEATDKPQRRLR